MSAKWLDLSFNLTMHWAKETMYTISNSMATVYGYCPNIDNIHVLYMVCS